VGPGTLVFVPPTTPHAIRAIGGQQLVYVSATSPPFEAIITGQTWKIPRVRL
jgi:mannose-6-phosphate isomerase-like protein (cupin superfamily)